MSGSEIGKDWAYHFFIYLPLLCVSNTLTSLLDGTVCFTHHGHDQSPCGTEWRPIHPKCTARSQVSQSKQLSSASEDPQTAQGWSSTSESTPSESLLDWSTVSLRESDGVFLFCCTADLVSMILYKWQVVVLIMHYRISNTLNSQSMHKCRFRMFD